MRHLSDKAEYDKSSLELEADALLAPYLKDKKRNKTRTDQYPILSDSQLARRRSKEIPMSSLYRKNLLELEHGDQDD